MSEDFGGKQAFLRNRQFKKDGINKHNLCDFQNWIGVNIKKNPTSSYKTEIIIQFRSQFEMS